MFATFEEFRSELGDQRVIHLTAAFAPGHNPIPAIDDTRRRNAVESKLQWATDTIRAYAVVPESIPQIVKRWCLQLTACYLGQVAASSGTYVESDQRIHEEIMKELRRCKDGDMPWETEADQGIPSGPGPDAEPIRAFTPRNSCGEYSMARLRGVS